MRHSETEFQLIFNFKRTLRRDILLRRLSTNLGLLVLLVIGLLVFVVGHLLLGGLLRVKVDWESDELRVLLDEVFDLLTKHTPEKYS